MPTCFVFTRIERKIGLFIQSWSALTCKLNISISALTNLYANWMIFSINHLFMHKLESRWWYRLVKVLWFFGIFLYSFAFIEPIANFSDNSLYSIILFVWIICGYFYIYFFGNLFREIFLYVAWGVTYKTQVNRYIACAFIVASLLFNYLFTFILLEFENKNILFLAIFIPILSILALVKFVHFLERYYSEENIVSKI